MTPEQEELDERLWWTTVRPWLAQLTSWPSQWRSSKPRLIGHPPVNGGSPDASGHRAATSRLPAGERR